MGTLIEVLVQFLNSAERAYAKPKRSRSHNIAHQTFLASAGHGDPSVLRTNPAWKERSAAICRSQTSQILAHPPRRPRSVPSYPCSSRSTLCPRSMVSITILSHSGANAKVRYDRLHRIAVQTGCRILHRVAVQTTCTRFHKSL